MAMGPDMYCRITLQVKFVTNPRCYLMAKFLTNLSGGTWWPILELVHVLMAKFAPNKKTPVMNSIAWVPCVILTTFATYVEQKLSKSEMGISRFCKLAPS